MAWGNILGAVAGASAVGNAIKNIVSKAMTGSGSTGSSAGSTTATSATGSSGTGNGTSGGIDYSLMLQNAINNNASAGAVQALLDARNAKIGANSAYYAGKGISGSDSISKVAQAYIDGQNNPAQYQYGNFDEYAKANGMGTYSDEVNAATRAMVNNAISGYQNQIDTTNKDSAELARQAYIAKMLGQKNLDQQLSASGYSGGMADSQKIQTETNYQNNLTSIENQRQATVNQLQTAITQAKASGDQQTAEQLASYLQNLQSGWSSYVNNQNSLNASQAQFNTSQAANAKSTAYTQAMNTLSAGVMPDSATLAAAGISSTTAALIRNYYLNQIQLANQQSSLENQQLQKSLAEASIKSSSAKSSGSSTKTTTAAKSSGVRSTTTTAAKTSSSAAADGMTADEAWAAYRTQAGNGISDYSQLGTAAKKLFSDIQRSSARTGTTKSSDKYLDLVEAALQKGTVTEAEAEFILDKIGV